jgi:hypothetical protein
MSCIQDEIAPYNLIPTKIDLNQTAVASIMAWCQQSETKNAELTRRTSLGMAKPAAAFAPSNLSDLLGQIDHTIFDHHHQDTYHQLDLNPLPAIPGGLTPRISEMSSNSLLASVDDVIGIFGSSSAAETPLEATSMFLSLQPKRGLEQVSQGVAAELAPPAKKHKTDVAKEAVDESSCNFFRAYQAEQWTQRFKELCDFCKSHGHCQVPHTYQTNPALARWVKRQRYQYKLRFERKASTMTQERVAFLEKIGFVWDSHVAAWEERKAELLDYRAQYGHCNVPSNYSPNRQLAVWVKRQRRQYKFFCDAKPSSMTTDRISTLESLGFEWELRCREPKNN